MENLRERIRREVKAEIKANTPPGNPARLKFLKTMAAAWLPKPKEKEKDDVPKRM